MAGKVKLTDARSRKLGSAQLAVLRFIERHSRGIRKADTVSSDWRVIDRLYDLGFLFDVFVPGKGPTYFLTDAGRTHLASSGKTSGE